MFFSNVISNNLESRHAKDEPGQHWLKLVQWFQKIFEIVYTRQTDGQMTTNAIRWQYFKRFKVYVF
jgi:hypothetical protein